MLPLKLSLTEAGTSEWRMRVGAGQGKTCKCATLIPNVERMDFLPNTAGSG